MLIIYSHPNKLGHCGYILEKITEKLKIQNSDFELLDLYESNFDPRLKPGEHYTSGNKNISPETQEIQEKIKSHNYFIFIYPTWWGGPPSILKGFFDRVLTPGFGYYYKNGIPHGLLKNKKAVVITTTGGPKIAKLIGINTCSLKTICRNTLGFCGIKSKGYTIDKALKLNDRQKNKIEKLINKINL